MDAPDKPLTVAATTPAPYVHLDNRALVVHDGRDCVVYGNAAFAWIAETLRVILAEHRATRQQGPQVFGGFVHDDGRRATLYASSTAGHLTCELAVSDLEALQAKLGRR